ncbi:MAG: GPW/gp25 family protein [Methylocystis sp.]|uniref:GPW/gp25 family protein n=1 Tax=Methylocystis sp. TaxID=1911079 RepID=UPI003DA3E0E5
MTEFARSRSPLPSTFQLLGRGLASPIRAVENGRLCVAEGPEKVRQAIFTILETEPGERVMLPEFGCGLQRFIMEPNSYATRASMERDISIALQRFEPRIQLDEVSVTPANEDPAMALVEIRYRHLASGREDNLVFPFYFG